ncbi:MAG: hypothetical protein LBF94_04385, partial [Puniceicoccales bacterium]|nr:hypothetical protein [Puniceicoccales bacterium]
MFRFRERKYVVEDGTVDTGSLLSATGPGGGVTESKLGSRPITPGANTLTVTGPVATATPAKPLDGRSAQVEGAANRGEQPKDVKVEPQKVQTTNMTNPAEALASIAAVQQEEAGVDSERWPNRVITAARQIQTT